MGDPETGWAAGAKFDVTPDKLETVVEDRDVQWVLDHGGTAGVARLLRISPDTGISSDELAEGLATRSAFFGPNKFKYPPPKSFIRLVYEAFQDVTIMILSVAAIVALTIGLAVPSKRADLGYLEGCAIVLVVLVVVFVQAGIDYQKELKFRQLNAVKDNYSVQALRAGHWISVPSDDILVGDVLKVSAGDKLAADALLIRGSKLKTNESSMTGEVADIAKDPVSDPFLLSGTTVSQGVGFVLVIAVGESSQWGTILASLTVETEPTPLQVRLNRLASTIGKVGIFFAVLIFVVSMIRWGVRSGRAGRAVRPYDILEYFIDAVSIVVVAIPEGLPLAITLGLAFAMRKMMADKNLVRRLEACETMGSATQLNADKTGTLTQNRMTVVEALWSGSHVVYQGEQSEQAMAGSEPGMTALFRQLAAASIAVNSQASLEHLADGRVEHLGSKTECALLQLVEKWGFSYEQVRAQNPSERIYLFDSTKKRMSTTMSMPGGRTRVFTKGAPEIVVRLCDKQLDLDGQTLVPMDRSSQEAVIDRVEGMAARGLRTLLLAYRDVDHDRSDENYWKDAPETELVLVGVVGIKDPIRTETKDAVRLLKNAGVAVRMVTGDNPLTATFIAREAGILDDDGLVVTGPEFRKMSATQMDAIALKIQVLARSTPNDKLILVRELKKLGEVVAVTGDGTNDAPALKEAHIGFALGIAGTEIAKEACDIVILDDNIQSMAKAALWGRNVYESIRKFLQFQLVVNVVAVTLNVISAIAGIQLPLKPVPLLWVNMIMDSMGALALATEPPRQTLMERKPFGRRAPLINRAMLRNILGVAIYQLVVCFVLQFAGTRIFALECLQFPDGREGPSGVKCPLTQLNLNAIIFNTFVFMQIFSEINSRRIDERDVFGGIFHSYMFISIIGVTVGIQIALILAVGGTRVGQSIGIGHVSWPGWIASVLLGALVLPWGFLVRCWPLDWCFGPLDDDPTEMSKIEKMLRIRARKAADFKVADESTTNVSDSNDRDSAGQGNVSLRPVRELETTDQGDVLGPGALELARLSQQQELQEHQQSPSPAIIKLRVFVHAVAFVNIMSKTVSVAEDPRTSARDREPKD